MHICRNYRPDNYMKLLSDVIHNGNPVSVRDMKTVEVLGMAINIKAEHNRERIHWHKGRWENPAFAYAEWLFMIQGEDQVDKFTWYAPQMAKYADEGANYFHGAYGPRLGMSKWPVGDKENLPWNNPYRFKEPLRYKMVDSEDDHSLPIDESDCGSGFDGWRNFCTLNQMYSVYMKLKMDKFTRQAVMTIWNANEDNDLHADMPCTNLFQFLIRDDKLHCHVYMRSQDLLTGFLYDTMHFRLFQEILAGWLEVDIGDYNHFVGSLHVYDYDSERIKSMLDHDKGLSLYENYEQTSAMVHPYDEWVDIMVLISLAERHSREGRIGEADKILNVILYDENQLGKYWGDFILSLVSVNFGKWGHTHKAIELAKQVTGPVQVPIMARALTYHAQQGGEEMVNHLDLPKIKPYLSSIKLYIEEKTGKLQMAPGVA